MGEYDEMAEEENRKPTAEDKAAFVENEVNQRKGEFLEDWDSIIEERVNAVLFTEKGVPYSCSVYWERWLGFLACVQMFPQYRG